MTLRLTIFGREVSALHLELDGEPDHVSVVDKTAKNMSRWFFGKIAK